MHHRLRLWLGMGGVPPHDCVRAYAFERRLHWVMVAAALLALPAVYLGDRASGDELHMLGTALDLVIFGVFAGELLWMLHLTEQKWLYLRRLHYPVARHRQHRRTLHR